MKQSRTLIILVLILAIIGALDASYLTYEHYAKVLPPCSNSIWVDCGKVLTSKYSMMGPFPVSLLGLLSYSTLIGLTIIRLAVQKEKSFKESLWRIMEKYARPHSLTLDKSLYYGQSILVLNAALFSLYFVFIQLAVLHAICLYCMMSAIICFIIFGVTVYEYFAVQKKAL